MEQAHPRNGTMELKFNEDRTLVLATIHPASNGGEAVTVADVHARLTAMGVTYGVRDDAISVAIDFTQTACRDAVDVIVATGAIPVAGTDAQVRYRMPLESLAQPLPTYRDAFPDHPHVPNWFALDPRNFIKAGQDLATIIPAQPGVPGQTLTWPIKAVPAGLGRPPAIHAGCNVTLADGTRLVAAAD